MNAKRPPNLYQRQYLTRGRYKRTLYYARFYDWKHVRRVFPLGPDFNEAKDRLAEYLRLNRQRHDFDKPDKPDTLAAWIDKLIALKQGSPIAERHGYSAKRLKAFFKDRRLGEVTHAAMLEYRRQRKAVASVATINRELALLKSVLILAKHEGALPELPVIPFEEEHNDRVRTASDIEYRRVLKMLRQGDRDFAEIIREMGFRPKDVHAITPADLDMRNKAIDMGRIRSKHGHKRPLPLSPRAWAILSRRARTKTPHELLFPFTRHRIRTAWKRACDRLGIRDLWLYDLRATFVTAKLREGWPVKFVREFSGHRTNTIERYVRPTMEDLKAFIAPDRQRAGHRTGRARGKGRVSARMS